MGAGILQQNERFGNIDNLAVELSMLLAWLQAQGPETTNLYDIKRGSMKFLLKAFAKLLENRKRNLECTVFQTGDMYVGVARDTIRDGDILVRFDVDHGVHFILEPVGDEMFELVART